MWISSLFWDKKVNYVNFLHRDKQQEKQAVIFSGLIRRLLNKFKLTILSSDTCSVLRTGCPSSTTLVPQPQDQLHACSRGKAGALLPPASSPASAFCKSSSPARGGKSSFARTSELAPAIQAQAAKGSSPGLPQPSSSCPAPYSLIFSLPVTPRLSVLSIALSPSAIRLRSTKLENSGSVSNLWFMFLF